MSEDYKDEFEELKKLYGEILMGTKKTIKVMKLMGDILNPMKKNAGHGNWIPLFNKHQKDLGFSLSWANKCMKVSRQWYKIPKDANGEPVDATAARAVEHLRVKVSSIKKDNSGSLALQDEISRLRQIHRQLTTNQTAGIEAEDRDKFREDKNSVAAWMNSIEQELDRLASARKWGPVAVVRTDGSVRNLVANADLDRLLAQNQPAAEPVPSNKALTDQEFAELAGIEVSMLQTALDEKKVTWPKGRTGDGRRLWMTADQDAGLADIKAKGLRKAA